ncbi:MAG: undecaprenyl-diphosphate phosphatase [Eubacteriales bacterium]|nr:undecaprenyl-diphosphate phosphatase [Eubacteriales bacterium]MDY4435643.1 undecaprenyl-diphosphate phosphatase [Candidatus Flemingibacterium sp.]
MEHLTLIELIKVIIIGIIQGITEWLPISSTGHMILADELLRLNVSDAFMEMFRVVIQFGSILAVVVLYFHKLNPFAPSKSDVQKRQTWRLWFKVIVGIIPAGIVGVLFDDWLNDHLYNYVTVAVALIVYGVAFIVIEKIRKGKTPRVDSVDRLDYKTALGVGCFQTLSLIPGTSRSGSTILGAMILGMSREAAAEFSFFMAIPVMLGASLLKMLKFGFSFTSSELIVLIVGVLIAFVVSVAAIKFLTGFIKKHSFAVFGWYRIILGAIVLGAFIFSKVSA